MQPRSMAFRRSLDLVMRILAGLIALGGCLMLAWILGCVVHKGIGSINWAFFTQLPPSPGESGGGMGNAIIGTIVITAMATLIGVPLGMLGGIFLAEYGRGTLLANAVRFCANLLIGVPSIIIGVFVYAILVKPHGSFSGYAGGVALSILMFPIILRTTEDMLRLVPDHLREAALALGIPRWRITFSILLRSAKTGILTGVLLAVARVSGETAPLLFTCLDSPYWIDWSSPSALHQSLAGPTPNLTVSIFSWAMSPYDNWINAAWAASLLITVGILCVTIVSRVALNLRRR